jgi:glutaredoxin
MRVITVYSKEGCHLCEDAIAGLQAMSGELEFQIEELDITSEDSLHRDYFDRIPVISIEGEEICEHFLQEALVRERLESRR